MKTIVISCTFAMMLLASAATASPLTWAQVGNLDTLITKGTTANSGDDTEMQWIADALGIPVGSITYEKVDGSGGANWLPVDGTSDVFAFDLGSEPSWFMVKTGAQALDGSTNFLFDNSDEEQFAVLDFDVLGFDKLEIGKISHVSIADGTETELTPVPEPASLTLLGAGLATVGAKLRRRKQRQAQ